MLHGGKEFFIGLLCCTFLLTGLVVVPPVQASEPFLGQITIFAGNFNPRGWAFCNGQLLPISQNSALFSLLGTTYGGDGRTTFALPDLRGRVAIHSGNGSAGPGLTPRALGSRSGTETVTLNINQIPSHNHSAATSTTATATVNATNASGNSETPGGNVWAAKSRDRDYSNVAPDVTMAADSVQVTASSSTTIGNNGGSQAHNNMPPYLAVNYIIALQGIFPSRN